MVKCWKLLHKLDEWNELLNELKHKNKNGLKHKNGLLYELKH